MKRIYHHYKKWEDFKAGMWRKESKEYEERELPKIIEFTGDHEQYGQAMIEMVKRWKFGCEHNLTNQSLNKRAWVGHAACCFKFGWPEYLVRQAWNLLTNEQRYLANKKADLAILEWQRLTTKTNQLSLW
jgi:hypothetical protein